MTAPRSLQGRRLLITGASSGIGAAVAREAAAAGMRLVLAARRKERLLALAAELPGEGHRVVPTDVSRREEVEALAAAAAADCGRLDALLANAGYGTLQPGARVSEEQHRRIFDVNYWGTVNMIQAVLPLLEASGQGHVLVTSSMAARVPLPFYGPYCATKAAQDALLGALRGELAPAGIHVTGIYPVVTLTEFHAVSARLSGRPGAPLDTPAALVQPASTVARAVLRALRRPRPEVWPSRLGRGLALLAALCPGAARALLRIHTRKAAALAAGLPGPDTDRG